MPAGTLQFCAVLNLLHGVEKCVSALGERKKKSIWKCIHNFFFFFFLRGGGGGGGTLGVGVVVVGSWNFQGEGGGGSSPPI